MNALVNANGKLYDNYCNSCVYLRMRGMNSVHETSQAGYINASILLTLLVHLTTIKTLL
jgi:hypothetical protein